MLNVVNRKPARPSCTSAQYNYMHTVQCTYNNMYILQTEILCVPSDILVEGDDEATVERREGERREGERGEGERGEGERGEGEEGDPTGIAQGGWKEEEGEGEGDSSTRGLCSHFERVAEYVSTEHTPLSCQTRYLSQTVMS